MRATNRAVLVLQEMPKQCIQCPCYSHNLEECRATEIEVPMHDAVYVGSRAEWCPLKYVDEDREELVIITDYMWHRAAVYLDFLFALRDNDPNRDPKRYDDIVPLKRRFDSGERSSELYDTIMNAL